MRGAVSYGGDGGVGVGGCDGWERFRNFPDRRGFPVGS